MLPDFEAWAIFAKVAERGGFAPAAAELGLSRPTVSKAVARLEVRLGAPLFHRSSRRLSLSEAGRQALTRAQALLAAGEAIESDLAERGGRPRGLVRLAAPMSFGIRHLGPLLPAFLDRHPEIALDIKLSDDRTDLFAEGIDVALRIGALPDSSLRARRLLGMRTVVVASPAYLARMGRPEHPRDLERHDAIVYTHIASPMRWRFDHPLEGECTVAVRGRLLVNNGDIVTPALLAGAGIARQPEFLMWEELRAGTLVPVLPDWSTGGAGLHILTPPSPVRPARVAALIDFLAEHFARAPWAHQI